MIVCLLDTTILCNIVPVPGRDQSRDETLQQMAERAARGEWLLLPVATIVETGNHIADCGDGRVCRATAERFCGIVSDALDGEAPFTPTPPFELEALKAWLVGFPDMAMKGVGLADLSIIKEFERQCRLHPHGTVSIWSLDAHLSGYRQSGDP